MLDYGIPNDSLEQRHKTFKVLMTPDPKTNYIDGAINPLLRPYAKDRNLNQAQKLWLSILYATSYSCSTAIRLMEEFPTPVDIIRNTHKTESFWKSEKPTLWFNPDRRYVKNNNQVISALQNIAVISDLDLNTYLVPLLQQGFDATYKEIITKWHYYGPMAAYLFFDAVYGLSPELYTDPEHLDWKGSGQTVVEGMAHLLGEEESIATKNYDLPKYNAVVNTIEQSTGLPKIVIESNLCFFRKLFKGSRYMGYYADRDLEEYLKVDSILRNQYNIDIWKYRELTCQDSLRGEVHGWTGIRKEKLRDYLNTGKLI